MPIDCADSDAESEGNRGYRAPFSNYANLKVPQMPQGLTQVSGTAPVLNQHQFTNLTGRSDASSVSQKSLPMNWQGQGQGHKKPDVRELQAMAKAVGERCGDDQVEPAMSMLGFMTDVLFGARKSSQIRGAIPSYVHRPSPNTIERIVQRVGDYENADAARSLLTKLADCLFGQESGGSSPHFYADEADQDANLDMFGLLVEFCGALLSQ
jgi:hypothetical protein